MVQLPGSSLEVPCDKQAVVSRCLLVYIYYAIAVSKVCTLVLFPYNIPRSN
jgi:hypothetical protein